MTAWPCPRYGRSVFLLAFIQSRTWAFLRERTAAAGPVNRRPYVAKQPRAKGGEAAKLARPFRPHPPVDRRNAGPLLPSEASDNRSDARPR